MEMSNVVAAAAKVGGRHLDSARDVPTSYESRFSEEIREPQVRYSSSSSSESESDDEDALYGGDRFLDKQGKLSDKIPYMHAYDTSDETTLIYFIPAAEVRVKIVSVDYDEDHGIHVLNPHVYTIQLEHGPNTWVIQRRYRDFTHLHRALQRYRLKEKLVAPVRKLDDFFDGDDDERKKPQSPNRLYLAEADCGTLQHLDGRGIDYIDGKSPTPTSGEPRPCATILQAGGGAKFDDTTDGNVLGSPMTGGTVLLGQCRSRKHGRPGHRCKLPHFPITPERLIMNSPSSLEQRRVQLEAYLHAIVNLPLFRNHKETAEFLEVSHLSFVNNIGHKTKEGLIKKRPGGRRTFLGCKGWCIAHCARWGKRWLVVKDSFIAYMRPSNELIRTVMLYDTAFEIRCGAAQTEGVKHGILITNSSRFLFLKCKDEEQALLWSNSLNKFVEEHCSQWVVEQRFLSFAPVREKNYAQWFVDGRTFYQHAAEMMELAVEEIFITDWWLSPEIYMKRPMTEGNRWRLDQILKRKAEAGVKIYVLLYKEVEMALGLNSDYTKRTLHNLNDNIKVIRHPDHHLTGGTYFWAHHEKLIVIDQNVAFVGGIDLCYGRWDDYQHRLTDLGSVQFNAATGEFEEDLVRPSADELEEQEQERLRHLQAQGLMPHHADVTDGTLSPIVSPRDFAVPPDSYRQAQMSPRLSSSGKSKKATRFVDVSRIAIGDDGMIRGAASDTEETDEEDEFAEDSYAARGDHGDHIDPRAHADLVKGAAQAAAGAASPQPLSSAGRAQRHTAPASELGVPLASSEDTTPGPEGKVYKLGNRWRRVVSEAGAGAGANGKADGLEQAERSGKSKTWETRQLQRPVSDSPKHVPGSTRVDMATLVSQYKEFVESRKNAEIAKPSTPPRQRKADKLKSKFKAAINKARHIHLDTDLAKDYETEWEKLRSEANIDLDEVEGASKLWIGKDYVNFIYKDFTNLEEPFEDFIDRTQMPRMPWHDIHSCVYGSVARDVARHFIQRWNAAKIEKSKDDETFPLLVPKSYERVSVPKVFRRMAVKTNVQVVRSACDWSAGMNHTDNSIMRAYVQLIKEAKHYIYIENQFFVSMIDSGDVTNEICQVLYDRIIQAHTNKEPFRVFVMLPLMPAFEGQIESGQGAALQVVLHWAFVSISKGDHALLPRLQKAGVEPSRYISFCSLRTADELSGRLITELIYIHSKLMIVDDVRCIIGSANINDRSQLGKRDSEVCVVVEDIEFQDSLMGGQPYRAGKFCGSLRKHLFREHLGVLSDPTLFVDVNDPLSDDFYFNTWLRVASKNTSIFEKVFKCYPTDSVRNFAELQTYCSQVPLASLDREKAVELLAGLQGNLVLFPAYFLFDSDLTPAVTTKEGLVPILIFV